MFLSLRYRICLLLVLSCFVTFSSASSQRSLPLKRYGHPVNIALDILTQQDNAHFQQKRAHLLSSLKPRNWLKRSSATQVLSTDKIRLSFRAFSQDFFLHLQPTENLVHPDGAVVRYVDRDADTNQEVVREERLFQEQVRAFQGVVMHPDYTIKRMTEDRVGLKREVLDSDEGVMGWAAIVLRDDGSDSGQHSFEGSFTWAGNEHTIQLPRTYHTSRQEGDPLLSRRTLDRGNPIIHRRSDIMTSLEARAVGIEQQEEAAGCSADNHAFNSQNPLFVKDSNSDIASFSPTSFFASPLQSRHLSFKALLPVLRGKRAATSLDQENSYNLSAMQRRQSSGDDLAGGDANNSFTGDIGSTSGCPTSARVVYMGVASDCTYTARFSNSSETSVQLLTNMNTVSTIYRSTFRVSLGVVQLEIREAGSCSTATSGSEAWNVACSTSVGLDDRLSYFSQWRGTQPSSGEGLWHLLTACTTGSEVGVAWLGTLCKSSSSGQGADVISGTGVTGAAIMEAQVMAHEIGHNFGAIHDCITGCSISGTSASQSGGALCCPLSSTSCNTNGNYIMSPVSQSNTQTFSPCSIGNICAMLGGGINTTCLYDPTVNPRQTLSIQQCGNGILEPGEECDAGANGSDCCSTSCKLTSGSVCDPETSDCCTDSCQFASSSTVCRPAVDERCDTTETCSGTSDTCPTDVRKSDGSSCGDGLSCASGHCTSRDLQCQEQSQAGMNFTQACPASSGNSCSISCRNPDSFNSCLILQSQFLDGTQCGYGGTCSAGECQSGGWQSTFDSWYRDNLRISIPVTIVIGLLVLAILYCIGRSCFRRANQGNRKGMPTVGPRRDSRWTNPGQPSAAGPYQPPPPPQRAYAQDRYSNPYSSYNS